jgi:rhomboid protease GluP
MPDESPQHRPELPGFRTVETGPLPSPQNFPPPGFDPAAVRLAQFRRALFMATPQVFMTYVLIGINCAVFAAMLLRGVSPLTPTNLQMVEWGADFGPLTIGEKQWWRILTAAFLHFGIIHLGFNMWVLNDVGQVVERLLGNAGFLIMYLVSGLLASVASLAVHPMSIGAGASGAVFGVFGALGGFLVRQRDSIPKEILQRLGKSTVAFVGYNLLFSLMVPAIDMTAHVGGLVAGFLCGLVLAQPLTPPNHLGRLLRSTATALGGLGLVFLGMLWLAQK